MRGGKDKCECKEGNRFKRMKNRKDNVECKFKMRKKKWRNRQFFPADRIVCGQFSHITS